MSKLCDALRQLECDAFALVAKFHNYHWNVKGQGFTTLHSYTEEAYDEMFELYDDLAERVLQLEEKPVVNLQELVEKAQVPTNNNTSFSANEVITNLIADYQYLIKAFKDLATLADSEGDCVVASMCDDKLTAFEKRVWILKSWL